MAELSSLNPGEQIAYYLTKNKTLTRIAKKNEPPS